MNKNYLAIKGFIFITLLLNQLAFCYLNAANGPTKVRTRRTRKAPSKKKPTKKISVKPTLDTPDTTKKQKIDPLALFSSIIFKQTTTIPHEKQTRPFIILLQLIEFKLNGLKLELSKQTPESKMASELLQNYASTLKKQLGDVPELSVEQVIELKATLLNIKNTLSRTLPKNSSLKNIFEETIDLMTENILDISLMPRARSLAGFRKWVTEITKRKFREGSKFLQAHPIQAFGTIFAAIKLYHKYRHKLITNPYIFTEFKETVYSDFRSVLDFSERLLTGKISIKNYIFGIKKEGGKPEIDYDDIPGRTEEKEFFKKFINAVNKGKASNIPPILIGGPPGTGKSLFIHALSDKIEKDFTIFNSPEYTKPYQLWRIYSVLNKMEKGAGGTVFFDEFEKMPKEIRNNFLTVIIKYKKISFFFAVNDASDLGEPFFSRVQDALVFDLLKGEKLAEVVLFLVQKMEQEIPELKLGEKFNLKFAKEMVKKAKDFSIRDIKHIIKRLQPETDRTKKLTTEAFEKALDEELKSKKVKKAMKEKKSWKEIAAAAKN